MDQIFVIFLYLILKIFNIKFYIILIAYGLPFIYTYSKLVDRLLKFLKLIIFKFLLTFSNFNYSSIDVFYSFGYIFLDEFFHQYFRPKFALFLSDYKVRNGL